ncbi:LOW QUALITY PROTEIN: hypothetical protein PHMEG_00014719 [Phytophthora megakarya]|uniref:Uncharacterized protein n=1 Tax=Phytophthora megakarya TaxID=4795 RepID=A0A225W5L0_9STRA|nr:LOW QUALITY PROTEIN: hypothetical protein PHMEG_00014719 [Phytophthora megakarya]
MEFNGPTSVQTIQTQHLLSKDDRIVFLFYKTITNQDGSGPREPRHLYANWKEYRGAFGNKCLAPMRMVSNNADTTVASSVKTIFPFIADELNLGGILRLCLSSLVQYAHF